LSTVSPSVDLGASLEYDNSDVESGTSDVEADNSGVEVEHSGLLRSDVETEQENDKDVVHNNVVHNDVVYNDPAPTLQVKSPRANLPAFSRSDCAALLATRIRAWNVILSSENGVNRTENRESPTLNNVSIHIPLNFPSSSSTLDPTMVGRDLLRTNSATSTFPHVAVHAAVLRGFRTMAISTAYRRHQHDEVNNSIGHTHRGQGRGFGDQLAKACSTTKKTVQQWKAEGAKLEALSGWRGDDGEEGDVCRDGAVLVLFDLGSTKKLRALGPVEALDTATTSRWREGVMREGADLLRVAEAYLRALIECKKMEVDEGVREVLGEVWEEEGKVEEEGEGMEVE
jgi:hypothetical protein